MLEKVETENPKAIEDVIAKFGKLKCNEMDGFKSKTLVGLMLMPKLEMREEEKPFLVKVMEKRIEHCFTFSTKDQRLLLFLAVVSERVGTAIMYLWYLQYWCFKNNVRELTLDIFCQKVFPYGFPSNDTIETIWDAQKVKRDGMESDNLLDYASAGSSIQFKEEKTKS